MSSSPAPSAPDLPSYEQLAGDATVPRRSSFRSLLGFISTRVSCSFCSWIFPFWPVLLLVLMYIFGTMGEFSDAKFVGLLVGSVATVLCALIVLYYLFPMYLSDKSTGNEIPIMVWVCLICQGNFGGLTVACRIYDSGSQCFDISRGANFNASFVLGILGGVVFDLLIIGGTKFVMFYPTLWRFSKMKRFSLFTRFQTLIGFQVFHWYVPLMLLGALMLVFKVSFFIFSIFSTVVLCLLLTALSLFYFIPHLDRELISEVLDLKLDIFMHFYFIDIFLISIVLYHGYTTAAVLEHIFNRSDMILFGILANVILVLVFGLFGLLLIQFRKCRVAYKDYLAAEASEPILKKKSKKVSSSSDYI